MKYKDLNCTIVATINGDGDETCWASPYREVENIPAPSEPQQPAFGFHTVVLPNRQMGWAMHLPSDDA